jgi:hypothetical protein
MLTTIQRKACHLRVWSPRRSLRTVRNGTTERRCYSFDQEPAFGLTVTTSPLTYHSSAGGIRTFSSDSGSSATAGNVANESPEPLILKLVSPDDNSSSSSEGDGGSRPLVLMPPSVTNTFLVNSVESIIEAVNRYYTSSAQFVGGMGEQDPGVWFAPEDAMEACRSERHGVPFAVYTSGVHVVDMEAVAALRWDSVQVSLWAATPNDYNKCTGGRNDFAQVCGFIAQASEMNVPVEVGVLRQYAGPASSLALSLGARHVHVYDV